MVGTNDGSPLDSRVRSTDLVDRQPPRIENERGIGGAAGLAGDVQDRDAIEHVLLKVNVELESQVIHADLVKIGE